MTETLSKPLEARTGSKLFILCACLAQVMVVLDTTIIAVALPETQQSLGFSDDLRQWTITAYTLAFGSLLLIGGRISQILGIRRAFLIGLAGFAIASLIGGMATDVEVLLAARVGQGVFAALLAPTNLSLMNTAFSEDGSRAKAFAIFGAVAGAGAALGLILGGALTESMSWRWCFYVNVPLALLTALIAWRALHSAPGPARASFGDDIPGLVLGTGGVFSLVFGFSRAEEHGWEATATLIWLAAGLFMLIAFLVRERSARKPLLPMSILTDPIRASAYLAIGMVGIAQMGSSIYLTFYLQDNLNYSPLETGLAFLPMVGGLVVAAVLSTRILVPALGLRVVFPAGALIQTAAFWMLSSINAESGYLDSVLWPITVLGVGLGFVMAPAMSAATHGVSAQFSGLASATANTSQQLGASLGVAFLSTLAAQQATDFMESRAAQINQTVAGMLAGRGQGASSAQAAEVVDRVVATFRSEAEIAAYAEGFQALAGIAAVLAVVTFILLAITRAGGRSRGADID